MKVRQGFVSNSSSSSFICVIVKEAYDKIELRKDFRDILDNILEKDKLLGMDLLVYQNHCDMGGGTNYDSKYIDFTLPVKEEADQEWEGDDEWSIDNIFHEARRLLPKDSYVSFSQDW